MVGPDAQRDAAAHLQALPPEQTCKPGRRVSSGRQQRSLRQEALENGPILCNRPFKAALRSLSSCVSFRQ